MSDQSHVTWNITNSTDVVIRCQHGVHPKDCPACAPHNTFIGMEQPAAPSPEGTPETIPPALSRKRQKFYDGYGNEIDPAAAIEPFDERPYDERLAEYVRTVAYKAAYHVYRETGCSVEEAERLATGYIASGFDVDDVRQFAPPH